jgi:hypothetical protein
MAHCLAHVDPWPDAALDLLREGLRLIRSLKRFARQLSEPRGEPRRGWQAPPGAKWWTYVPLKGWPKPEGKA